MERAKIRAHFITIKGKDFDILQLVSDLFGVIDCEVEQVMTCSFEYGAPKRLYFDNGSQYRTHWMKRACTLLGIKLVYARPRNPQGKGKQERFNETVDQFIAECSLEEIPTLKDLNDKFQAWLNLCYTKATHSAIGTTPEIAYKSNSIQFPVCQADSHHRIQYSSMIPVIADLFQIDL